MKKLAVLGLVVLPSIAFAQGAIRFALDLINQVIPLIFALAVLFFLWNLAQFMMAPAEKKDDARTGMIWGVIILVVMSSIFGIVALVQDTLTSGSNGLNVNESINTPNIQFNQNAQPRN